jgi:dTDP-glucose pyrophosphorylase
MTSSKQMWRHAILQNTSTVGQVIGNLNKNAIKIVLIVNETGVLEGTISDGDIRRALLRGLNLNSPITDVIHRNALVVPPEMNHDLIKQLMLANKIQQIPVVDSVHNIVGLHLWDEIAVPHARKNLMVIMAGGKGTRLRPYTENCPKPLIPVGGKPMLEHIIDRAKLDGFTRFVLAIHYLGHMIEEHFGDGAAFGVQIEYLREESPLGTAGALGLINPIPESPIVVTNGDVITEISYGQMLDFHIRQDAAGTIAVRPHEWQHPFGVVQMRGLEVVSYQEKPITRTFINAGVYAFEPHVLNRLSARERCDMPTILEGLRTNGQRIVAYPMHEPWIDVGRPDDLLAANKN